MNIILQEVIANLDILSYKSSLGKSLKNTLRKFEKKEVIKEIIEIKAYYDDIDVFENVSFR